MKRLALDDVTQDSPLPRVERVVSTLIGAVAHDTPASHTRAPIEAVLAGRMRQDLAT
jgi:hypothetical protein